MIPIKLTNDTWPPKDGEFCSSIVLYYDNWNDYSYRTSFVMCYCDADGMVREVGNVKIYYWQNDEVRTNQYSEHTKSSLGDHIESLSASYCSLGQELSYYKNLKALLPNDYFDILTRLNDIAIFDAIKNRFINEKGVQSSLLRFSGAEKALNEAKGIIYEGLQTTKDIQILDRVDNSLNVRKPDIECFGNNISEIVFDVFDVTSVESNFKSHLRKLSQNKSYNDILELFDGNLSLNALIFLKSCYMGGD